NRETSDGHGNDYSSLRVNTIGTCMWVFTLRPPLRPGLNFHLLTAWTAAASNSRCDDLIAYAFCTSPLESTMKSTVTSPAIPARRISNGYCGRAWNFATGCWASL